MTLLLFYFCTLVLLYSFPAWAENIYVDGSLAANCTGNYSTSARNCTGSAGDAYQTIQGAFNDSSLGSADVIHIRTGTYSEVATLGASGASGSPIIVQPYLSETPTLRCTASSNSGVIQFTNRSHITIQNLRFIATGLATPCLHAIYGQATGTTNVTGITISGSTFTDWGGNNANYNPTVAGYQTIRLNGTYSGTTPTATITATIADNVLTGGVYQEIRIGTGLNVVIERNEISGTRCGQFQDNRTGAIAIFDSAESVGTIIRKNYVHNLDQDCAGITLGPDESLFGGIYCDVGAEKGIIEDNLVHDIHYPGTWTDPNGTESAGIFIESRCLNWIVRRNVVFNIGRKGLRHGSASTSDPNDTQIIHNTFFNIEQRGIHLIRGQRLTLRNNLVVVNSGGVIPIETAATFATQGPHQFDGNLYYMAGSTNVGRWDGGTYNLTNWKSRLAGTGQFSPTTADDDDSISCNPGLIGSGRIAALSSCAVDAGQNISGYAKNGPLPTIGALDPPRFASGEVGLVNATTTILTLTNNVSPPLLPATACTGFTRQEENPAATWNTLAVSACDRQGTNQIKLTHAAATDGRAQRVSYSGSSVTTSALIGNLLNQPFLAITDQSITENITGTPPSAGGEKFVAITGNDTTGDGSSGNPWRTISKCVTTNGAAGNTCTIRAGTYYEQINVRVSGSSGNPFVIRGECTTGGAAANCTASNPPITFVHGAATSVGGSGWTVYSGSIYQKTLGFQPAGLVDVSGITHRAIWKIANQYMDGTTIPSLSPTGNGLAHMAVSASTTVQDCGTCEVMPYWSGLEGWMGYTGGVTYLRYRNGDNPNSKTLYAGSEDSCTFDLNNSADYVTIRNLEIGSITYGVCTYSGADNNIIEYNKIHGGKYRVGLLGGINNIVRNNVMESRSLGILTYGDNLFDSTAAIDTTANYHVYLLDKFARGETAERDAGVLVWPTFGAVTNNSITANTLQRLGMCAWFLGGDTGTRFDQNVCDRGFNIGLHFNETSGTTYINDNLINRFGRYGIRWNWANVTPSPSAGPFYVYKNKFNNLQDNGHNLAITPQTGTAVNATIWIYQNSFNGGFASLTLDGSTHANTRFVNNVLDSDQLDDGSGGSMGKWDYNWLRCGSSPTGAGTNNLTNTCIPATQIWSEASLPDFILPVGNTAINSGLNLGAAFTLQGTGFSALPGMIDDASPDRGVFPQAAPVVTSGVFAQTHTQAYGMALVNGVLQTRPVSAAVNQPVKVIKGGSVIIAGQITCTGANCPTIGAKFQTNRNSAGWVDVPDTFGAENVRFSGTTNTDPSYPPQGFAVIGCINATGLTAVNGSVQRTSDAVPNFQLNQNQCLTLASMIDFDTDITPGDAYEFRWINQDGTVFAGDYVLALALLTERTSGAGF